MELIPLIVRATFNATGAITFTGNTLGLSRSTTAGTPGTQDSIGAFTTTNTSSVYGTYPAGTTSAYQSNSSAAILNIPTGSTILYAELVWGGSYIISGSINLSSFINDPVTFITPAGTNTVTPDPATANSIDFGNGVTAYVRSANVTSLVQQGGTGTYSTGGVVGTIVINNDPTGNHAGWTLGVIYQNPTLPFRNMSIRAGAVLVQADSGPVTTTLTGFATPVSGALGGRALFSAQEGDANRTGDQALFGPTSPTAVVLSGPNNFANNFFASQINNDTGQLNTTGTFGTRNQTNGAPGSNIVGGRQGWDITNVDISPRLVNNQSSAVLILTTSGDAYAVNANAIQVDINAPKINVTKSASVTTAVVGDTITYTVAVSNTGTANATSVVLSDTLPTGLTFVNGSVTVAGIPRPTYDILAGAPLGTVNFSTSVTVTYRATVTSNPSSFQLINTANASFTFQSVAGGSTITGVIPSSPATVTVLQPNLALTKSSNRTNATVGSTVTYTILVANSGNIAANITLSDNIPAGSSFITGTFRVNGSVITGANPAAGVAIGSVEPGATSTVTFQVQVNSLPSPPQFVDQAVAAYTFTPSAGRTISGSSSSNTLTIPVTLPNIAVVKSANFLDVAVGDTLTYTSVISNNGTEAVTNAVFNDPIPAGAVFVPGSVTIAGAAVSSANPANGVSLGTLSAGSSVTVTFQISVQSIPASGSMLNQSTVSYSSGTFQGTSVSNTITTPVYQPVITVAKSASTSSATVGNSITYTLLVRNTGNRAAQVMITDNLPTGTSFVPNSVTVGGTVVPGATPTGGINAGNITAGSSVTVTFQVTLDTLPSPPSLVNIATASFTYQLPSGRSLSGSAVSNSLTIPASAPNVTVVKSANQAAATVSDVITYTITATNAGTAPVNNVIISDPIPDGTTFITGSVTLAGSVVPGGNPANGVAVGTITAGASAVLTFQVQVNSLPGTGQLSNRASTVFTSGTLSATSLSNTLVIPVSTAIISMNKTGSTTNATVGDTLSYQLQVNNTGNTSANIILTDPIPSGSTFIENSVLINSVPVPGVSPATGISLGLVNPGTTVTVSFVVTVTSMPASRQLTNQGTSSYTYNLPGGRQVTGSTASNSVTIPVSLPNVTIVKAASPSYAVVGDTIIFTNTITNNGTSNANNISLFDKLPSNASFIPQSVIVNGVSRPAAVPSEGISIGTLTPGAAATVTFEVKITMPIPAQINNQSTVSFTSGTFSGTASSNITTTPVIQPQIAVTKSANNSNATVGDSVTYTITVSNSGNLAAAVTLTDTIPPSTTFSPNSVIVNGFPLPGSSPATGIDLGSIAAGGTSTVTFVVVIDSLPNPQFISNQATAAYTFVPPDGRTLTGSALSNTVTIPVSAPNVNVAKTTATTATTVGDTITYTIVVSNSGIETVANVQLSDIIPVGASFVPGSVSVNGTPLSTANPANGIQLGSIAPNTNVTVVFSIIVNAVPATGTINNIASATFTSGAFSGISNSNTLITPAFNAVPSINKSANTSNATVGDTVTYTFLVGNSGNYPEQVTLTDNIPSGTSLVPNSILVNGVPQPGAEPTTGINAGTVNPGETRTVVFSVVVNSLPSPQQIVNQGTASAAFTLPDGRTFTRTAASNTLTIPVSAPNVSVLKSTPSTALTVGDTITYTSVVTNNGIAAVSNVLFTDAIPTGSSFVPGSVIIDGTARPGANPATGTIIGTIAPGASITITFSVSVTSLPPTAELDNQSSVSFTSGTFSGVTFSNTITTPVYQPIFTAQKTASTTNATVGDTVVFTIRINNSGNFGAAVTVTDTPPAGTTFVPNSVILNGQPLPGTDPSIGIPIGVVVTTATLTFAVIVNEVPPGQQLVNQASASLTYTLPDSRVITGSFASNTLSIPVSNPDVSVVKTSSVSVVSVGTVIPYTITVTNNGIENVTNALLSDIVDPTTQFVAGSVTVNNVPIPSANPATGVQLGTIAPGSVVTVSFNVTVLAIPTGGTLTNQSSVTFSSGAFTGTTLSNTSAIAVYQAILDANKTADTSNATVGDTITYTVAITNNGNIPAQATLTDPVPAGAIFVPNSIQVNGVPQPGADPNSGFSVGTVNPGETVSVSVTMQITVDSLPNPQQLVNQATVDFTFQRPDGVIITGSSSSNTLIIPVSSPDISVVKSTPSIDAVVGDTITYTISVTNNGIEAVNNVVLIDPVPTGSQFVGGSVTVDGLPRPSADPNTGINIGTIAAGDTVVATFQVRVTTI